MRHAGECLLSLASLQDGIWDPVKARSERRGKRIERERGKERKNAHRPSNRALKGLNTNEAERKAIIQRSNSWQPSPGLTLSLRGSHLGVHSNSGVLWAFSLLLLLLLLSTSLQSKSWIGIIGEREKSGGPLLPLRLRVRVSFAK